MQRLSTWCLYKLSKINLVWGPSKCTKSNFNPVHLFLHSKSFCLVVLKLKTWKTCTRLKFDLEHFNGPQNKFILDSLYKHPVFLKSITSKKYIRNQMFGTFSSVVITVSMSKLINCALQQFVQWSEITARALGWRLSIINIGFLCTAEGQNTTGNY